MGWIIAALVILALGLLPRLLERRRPRPGARDRAAAAGRFARLSDGETYYEWHGPTDGNVLVLVHGLSTPSHVWAGLIRGLTAMGFRVLSYDLFGRGLSDAPPGRQTRGFFLRQLRELLNDQGVTGDVTLMGYSMGGQIAAILAAEEPERVERLILLAPAGFGYTPPAFEAFVRDTPLLGDWLHLLLSGPMMRARLKALDGVVEEPADLVLRQAAVTRRRGFLPAVLSSQRGLLTEDLRAEMIELRRMGVPVLAIWGSADAVIPPRAPGRLAEVNRDARHVSLDGASHWLPLTHPREVLNAISAFLRES